MRRIYTTTITGLLFFITVVFFGTQIVGAQGKSASSASSTKVQTGKMRSCQAREAAVKTRAVQLTRLATAMEEKFASISARVENRYTTKLVPAGKVVANYEDLLAEIQTKKAAVDSSLKTAQDNATTFSCATDNPKEHMTQFRKNMQTVKQALKEYRTAIKNLIVSIAKVTGGEKEASESGK